MNVGDRFEGEKFSSDTDSSHTVIKVLPRRMEQVVTQTAKLDTPRGRLFGAVSDCEP